MDELKTREVERRRSELPQERPRGESYALLVGINDYRSVETLRYAVSDATVLADKLEEAFGFQVTRLINQAASGAAVREALAALAQRAKPDDGVLVFFAGHGKNHPAGEGGQGYLLPADATIADPSTWLAESELVERARDLPARWVFLMFDACYAGSTFRHDVPSGAREGRVLRGLVAGTGTQQALDGGAGHHSVFTRAVLDGLDGWADSGRRPDDVITAGELIEFVKHEVPWRSRVRGHRQTPVGGLLMPSSEAEDFEFRPTEPRIPAPLLRNIHSANAEDRVAAARQLGTRAPRDPENLLSKKAHELRELLDDKVTTVRVAAAEALGELGRAEGREPLSDLLDPTCDAPSALRAAAASALGRLARIPDLRTRAVQALTQALCDDDQTVREAAKVALGGVPGCGPQLADALKEAGSAERGEILDALACLAQRQPDAESAWLEDAPLQPRLLHRVYLARRRLRPQWRRIGRQSLALGVSGAVGLTLAYLVVVLQVKSFIPYGAALLSYNLLPGALAGVSLALVPPLAHALARRQGAATQALGGIAAGLVLGLGLYLPNTFVGIGGSFAAHLLPGLLSGPLLGLAFAYSSRGLAIGGAPEGAAAREGEAPWRWALSLGIVVGAGALGFALVRVRELFMWGYMDPPSAEVYAWGVSGALFAASLAVGWIVAGEGDRARSHLGGAG